MAGAVCWVSCLFF